MSANFNAKIICMLGRQPTLGLVELESLYGANIVRPGPPGAALLDMDAFDIEFKKLGGTIKVAKILNRLPYNDWPNLLRYLRQAIPEHLKQLEPGKFTLGISLYGLELSVSQLNRDVLSLKKIIRAGGRAARVVPNKESALSSAQVLHNQLTKRGAWELLLIHDGQETILAQTIFVQDINAYAARDQSRPARDAKVGMLPPKLAQMIINLCGRLEGATILDPFCGTGVILQEGLLMGYKVIGSDLDQRMVAYSKKNLDWLAGLFPGSDFKAEVMAADATACRWPPFDTVASELYLGRPLAKMPPAAEFKQIVSDVNTISKKFLLNLYGQLRAGTRFCVAVPAWLDGKRIHHLPLVDHLTDMGYNRYDFVHVRNDDLLYYREGQVVARELLVLERMAT